MKEKTVSDRRTDGRKDGRTDRRTDKVSYRATILKINTLHTDSTNFDINYAELFDTNAMQSSNVVLQ